MVTTHETELAPYFQQVRQAGNLLTDRQARRWSTAVLKTLGFHLDRSTKKALHDALPSPLAGDLTRVFWLLHFRNPNLSLHEFLDQVARRSGNTDVWFARFPTGAVFAAVKGMIDPTLSQRVAESLSPEVGAFWRQA